MCEDKDLPSSEESADSLSSGKLPKQAGRKAKAQIRSNPSSKPANKKIHPRQKIPPVPKGKETPDDTPSQPIDLD